MKGWELTLFLRIDILWSMVIGHFLACVDFNPISLLAVRGLRSWAQSEGGSLSPVIFVEEGHFFLRLFS
jgi:hypothetical protein